MAKRDEGEPQTKFLHPAQGGSYLKAKDGSLTRVEGPPLAGESKRAAKSSAASGPRKPAKRVPSAAKRAAKGKAAKSASAAAAPAESKAEPAAKE